MPWLTQSTFAVEFRCVITAGVWLPSELDEPPRVTSSAATTAMAATRMAPPTTHAQAGTPPGPLLPTGPRPWRAMPSPLPRRRARFSFVRCFWRWLIGAEL